MSGLPTRGQSSHEKSVSTAPEGRSHRDVDCKCMVSTEFMRRNRTLSRGEVKRRGRVEVRRA